MTSRVLETLPVSPAHRLSRTERQWLVALAMTAALVGLFALLGALERSGGGGADRRTREQLGGCGRGVARKEQGDGSEIQSELPDRTHVTSRG